MNETSVVKNDPELKKGSWKDGLVKLALVAIVLLVAGALALPMSSFGGLFDGWSDLARAFPAYTAALLLPGIFQILDAEVKGPRRRWFARRLASLALMLCVYAFIGCTLVVVMYHHPWRWAAVPVALATGGLITYAVLHWGFGPGDPDLYPILLVAGLFWSCIGVFAGHGDIRTLSFIWLGIFGSITVAVTVRWYRRHHYTLPILWTKVRGWKFTLDPHNGQSPPGTGNGDNHHPAA